MRPSKEDLLSAPLNCLRERNILNPTLTICALLAKHRASDITDYELAEYIELTLFLLMRDNHLLLDAAHNDNNLQFMSIDTYKEIIMLDYEREKRLGK